MITKNMLFRNAEALCVRVLKGMSHLPEDHYAASQLRRNSFSLALNIAEGIGRGSDKWRRNYLLTARGCACEGIAAVRIMSAIGTNVDHLWEQAFEDLCVEIDQELVNVDADIVLGSNNRGTRRAK